MDLCFGIYLRFTPRFRCCLIFYLSLLIDGGLGVVFRTLSTAIFLCLDLIWFHLEFPALFFLVWLSVFACPWFLLFRSCFRSVLRRLAFESHSLSYLHWLIQPRLFRTDPAFIPGGLGLLQKCARMSLRFFFDTYFSRHYCFLLFAFCFLLFFTTFVSDCWYKFVCRILMFYSFTAYRSAFILLSLFISSRKLPRCFAHSFRFASPAKFFSSVLIPVFIWLLPYNQTTTSFDFFMPGFFHFPHFQ